MGHIDLGFEDEHPPIPPGHPSFVLGADLNSREPSRGASFAPDKWYFVHGYPYPEFFSTQEERDAHDAIFMLNGAAGDDRREAAAVARCAWLDEEVGNKNSTKWKEWGNK